MNRFSTTIYYFSLRFVQILLLLLSGLLLASAFLATCYSTDMGTQLVLSKWDNPFWSLLGTALLALPVRGAASCICRKKTEEKAVPLEKRKPLSRLAILRLAVLGWCMAVGLVLILFGRSAPAADAYSVYSIAEHLAAGDSSVIHPSESYLSYYPQQAGLTAFWEILIRLWNLAPTGLAAYHFIKLVYLPLTCAIIFFGEKLVHLLWNHERTDCIYLLLAGLNCPLLMYSSFVYGEIPSFAALSAGLYLLTKLLLKDSCPSEKNSRSCLGLGSFFLLTLAVLLRKNSLIFVIAAVLVLLLVGLWQKRPALPLLAVCCMAGALAVLPCVQKYYELRSGSTISSGVPALSYLAMGMQESSRAEGWYNGFNFNTYQETGMDAQATEAASLEAIQERLSFFRKNPGEAARFYLRKYLSQWADGTYACRQATLATQGGRSPFFVSLYEGDKSRYLISYCNIYQNVLYLGTFVFCLAGCRKKRPGNSGSTPLRPEPDRGEFQLPAYLGLIAVLGGFLFHMAWEANSRYIFLYSLAMIPCAARGLFLLLCRNPDQ
jgi:hypothetical protein